MNLVHTSRKKVLALVVAVAMLATLITPLSASAYTIDDSLVPTEPMEVDNNIIKIGAHAAATTAVHYLGGNLVTERGSDFDKEGGAYGEGENSAGLSAAQKMENAKSGLNLTIFGSKLTSNPDPYLWNYFYNLYADANNK